MFTLTNTILISHNLDKDANSEPIVQGVQIELC